MISILLFYVKFWVSTEAKFKCYLRPDQALFVAQFRTSVPSFGLTTSLNLARGIFREEMITPDSCLPVLCFHW